MSERAEWTRRASRGRILLFAFGVVLLGGVLSALLYVSVPRANEGDGPVDALVVLGTPAGLQGELTPMEIWRVDEAVREFRRGQAPHMVLSGGPTANRFVEADVMAAYARRQGVPAEAILTERRSHTTLQNIQNSAELLGAHGWRSVEVISSRQHLPRAAVLLEKTGLRWRVHAAPTPGWGRLQIAIAYAEEAFGTAMLRVFGRHAEPVLHGLALLQHGVAWGVRWVVYEVEGVVARSGATPR